MTRTAALDALLAELAAERYDNTWWASAQRCAEAASHDDSDVTIARRRRELAEDFDSVTGAPPLVRDLPPKVPANTALTGGRWQTRRGVQVWVADESAAG